MSKWQKFNLFVSNLVYSGALILLGIALFLWGYDTFIKEPWKPIDLAEEQVLEEAAKENVRIQWITVGEPVNFNQDVEVEILPIGVSREVSLGDGFEYKDLLGKVQTSGYGFNGGSYNSGKLVNLLIQYPNENKSWVLFECRVKIKKFQSLTINGPSLLVQIDRADNCSDKTMIKNSIVSVDLKAKSLRVFAPPRKGLDILNINTQNTFIKIDKADDVQFPLLKRPNKLVMQGRQVVHTVGQGKNKKEVFVYRPYELDLVTGKWRELVPSETLDTLQEILDGRQVADK